MKRLFLQVSDLKETCDITHELENMGVDTEHIHVYSHSNKALEKEHIHPANAFQIANLFTVLGRGLLIGAVFSVSVGLLFYFGLHSMLTIPPLGYAAIIGFGLGFGFWISGLLGVEELKHFIDKYYSYVNQGHFLMMIDDPKEREDELMKFVKSHHGNVVITALGKH